ncbi:MAG: metallophosphoesterase family protein [Anaerorhabdus sp.]
MKKDKVKVIVMSDNHGHINPIVYLKNIYVEADMLIHCGDYLIDENYLNGLIFVRGNNDYDFNVPEEIVIKIKNHKCMIVHGHKSLFNGKKNLVSLAKRNGCDVIFYGHTHIFDDSVIDGVRIINPGSLHFNRDGSKPSYAEVIFEDDKINVTRKKYKF